MYISICICRYMHTYIHVHIYMYMQIYAYIYTHIKCSSRKPQNSLCGRDICRGLRGCRLYKSRDKLGIWYNSDNFGAGKRKGSSNWWAQIHQS